MHPLSVCTCDHISNVQSTRFHSSQAILVYIVRVFIIIHKVPADNFTVVSRRLPRFLGSRGI